MEKQSDIQHVTKEVECIFQRVKRKVRDDLYDFFYAVDIFDFVPVKERIKEYLCTDGEHIFYNPEQIMSAMSAREFTSGYNETFLLEKLLSHMTIHGMLGHFEAESGFMDKVLVGTIMDAQVNYILELLGSNYSGSDNEGYDRLVGYSEYYKALADRSEFRRWFIKRDRYKADNHELWMNDKGDERKNHINNIWKNARDLIYGSDIACSEFELINKSINRICDKRSQSYGNKSGNEVQLIKAADDKGISYGELINKLVTEKEYSKELADSIDIMMYTYGLELYNDVALVEPNEVNEVKHLDNLIIAIDTSASCGGDVARRFIRETYNLFNQISDSFNIESIHLIQCDSKIHDEKIFESIDELPDNDEMEMNGFGGTSFIPVLKRADELQQNDNKSVEAVIFFTDGYGDFPKEKTDYPVYLVMAEEDINDCIFVPEWAECVSISI